jgi:hypothetical protein
MRMTRVAVAFGVVAALAAGCSGGGGGAEEGSADGVPPFVERYRATCLSGAAFGGAPAYDEGDDPFPVAFLSRLPDGDDPGTFFVRTDQVGEGRAAEETSDPDDADEQARIASISVVACMEAADTEAGGETCEFEGDDGDTISLDLLDTTYEVTLRSAKTGAVIGTASFDVEADETNCPIIASIDEGQTTMLPRTDPTQVDAAIDEALG